MGMLLLTVLYLFFLQIVSAAKFKTGQRVYVNGRGTLWDGNVPGKITEVRRRSGNNLKPHLQYRYFYKLTQSCTLDGETVAGPGKTGCATERRITNRWF